MAWGVLTRNLLVLAEKLREQRRIREQGLGQKGLGNICKIKLASMLNARGVSRAWRYFVFFVSRIGNNIKHSRSKLPKLFSFLFSRCDSMLERVMLRYAVIFLIIALIAEAFGFSGVAGEASWIAHVLIVIAVIFLIISFVSGRRGPPAV